MPKITSTPLENPYPIEGRPLLLFTEPLDVQSFLWSQHWDDPDGTRYELLYQFMSELNNRFSSDDETDNPQNFDPAEDYTPDYQWQKDLREFVGARVSCFVPYGHCVHCGFRKSTIMANHAPDCLVIWNIYASSSHHNIDRWCGNSTGGYPSNSRPEAVTMDTVPVWTLLNWEARTA